MSEPMYDLIPPPRVPATRVPTIDMTPREYEILYYLLRGRTAKRIAERLCISYRTVEQYVDVLKDKFEAPTKSELIEKAIDLGYFFVVPASLEARQSLRGRAAPAI